MLVQSLHKLHKLPINLHTNKDWIVSLGYET
jgi:hypothetical protein